MGIYAAQVQDVDDPLQKGRIKVLVLALSNASAATADSQFVGWAEPRQNLQLTTPTVGDWVDIYFPDRSPHRMAYLGMAENLDVQRPASRTSPTVQTLFESRDEQTDAITFSAGVLKLLGSTEPFVKGSTFKTQLDLIIALLGQVKTSLTAWTPTSPPDLASWTAIVKTPLLPLQNGDSSAILSQKIKGV